MRGLDCSNMIGWFYIRWLSQQRSGQSQGSQAALLAGSHWLNPTNERAGLRLAAGERGPGLEQPHRQPQDGGGGVPPGTVKGRVSRNFLLLHFSWFEAIWAFDKRANLFSNSELIFKFLRNSSVLHNEEWVTYSTLVGTIYSSVCSDQKFQNYYFSEMS